MENLFFLTEEQFDMLFDATIELARAEGKSEEEISQMIDEMCEQLVERN